MWFKLLSKLSKLDKIDIYTDGGVKDAVSTWAYVIVRDQKICRESSGRIDTNDCNYAELTAAANALKSISKKSNITIYTDSRIVVDTMTLWAPIWSNQNWLKKNKRPIPFVDIIKELYHLNSLHNIRWRWVKSHSGNTFNERCDQLCRQTYYY
ncbi:MAG: ribonuclease HI [Bdellovibrionales bacterium]|nr:ribonuclease HI [Bdellovibrionales bacterium]